MAILTTRERRIIKAFAETLIPLPGGKLSCNMNDIGFVEKVEGHISHFANDVLLSFRTILFIFDLSAIFWRLKLRTFCGMKPDVRKKYLESWHNSKWAPKRALWRFLDAIFYMNFYSIPEVSKKIGYTPNFSVPKFEPHLPEGAALLKPKDHDVKEECDVCVIGSGAGGAVAAATLAKAGRKVVILEEGGYFTGKDFGGDIVSMTELLYRNGGVSNTFGWPAILVPVGRCVGGTTTINSGTIFRTPAEVLNKWVSEHGLTNWTPERVGKFYDEIEKTLQVAPANVLKKNTEVFRRGVEACGYSGRPLQRYAPGCCGSGVCCFGCPTNAKQSTQLSYIPIALEAGAKMYTHCQASRFLYSNKHAHTVIARFRDPKTLERMATLEVKARVVIVACGTLHTPVFLMRSHVPNPSGQIGHNLSLHPAAKVMARFDEEIRGWDEIPQGWYVDALAEEGIMLEGIFLPPAYIASTILHTGERHLRLMEDYNRIAAFGIMVSDTTRGRILRVPGGSPFAIYNLNKEDLSKFVRGISVVSEAFFKAGARSVILPIHTLPEVAAEEGLVKIWAKKIKAKDLDLQAFHPLGTCRMGADPEHAVTDPYGRFYGLDNVFIADGSIFPTSLGVNPMLTIMAAAMKIGGYIDREVL